MNSAGISSRKLPPPPGGESSWKKRELSCVHCPYLRLMKEARVRAMGRKKEAFGAKGIPTRSKDATNGAPGLTSRSNKLLETINELVRFHSNSKSSRHIFPSVLLLRR